MVSGACRAFAGETAIGLKLVEDGISENRQVGQARSIGRLLAISATAHLQAGNLGRALELLSESIELSEKTGLGLLRPEIVRLNVEGPLKVRQIDEQEAIARLKVAAALAKQQGALALEWRVTMSLAHLYIAVGSHDKARKGLRANYAKFTEGFKSLDLIEGKQLLDSVT